MNTNNKTTKESVADIAGQLKDLQNVHQTFMIGLGLDPAIVFSVLNDQRFSKMFDQVAISLKEIFNRVVGC
jgi:hypothetical protein